MNILPHLKKCPNCETINFFRVNGIIYDNELETLKDWTLKSKIKCRKCKITIGLFVNNEDKKAKSIWIDFIKCEETHLKKLSKLQKNKDKYRKDNKEKEFKKTIKEIQNVQNQIRLDQIKLKIKAKIENRLSI
tara:strand:- start:444 stop:842 length:399 start_codon:yes stop_codon:yes gene_type:complete